MPADPTLLAHWAETERRLTEILIAVKPIWPPVHFVDAAHMVEHNEHGCAADLMHVIGERYGWGDQREAFLACWEHMHAYRPPET